VQCVLRHHQLYSSTTRGDDEALCDPRLEAWARQLLELRRGEKETLLSFVPLVSECLMLANMTLAEAKAHLHKKKIIVVFPDAARADNSRDTSDYSNVHDYNDNNSTDQKYHTFNKSAPTPLSEITGSGARGSAVEATPAVGNATQTEAAENSGSLAECSESPGGPAPAQGSDEAGKQGQKADRLQDDESDAWSGPSREQLLVRPTLS
jgi:hypothetical protein